VQPASDGGEFASEIIHLLRNFQGVHQFLGGMFFQLAGDVRVFRSLDGLAVTT